MIRHIRRGILPLAFIALFGGVNVAPLGAQEPEEEQENPFAEFEELAEGAEVSEGFFDLYEKEGQLYLAIPVERLGEEFLLDYRVAQGIGAAGLYGGTTLSYFEMDLVALEKHGERIYLVQRPHQFTSTADDRVADAVEITYGSSVVESADIEAERHDSAIVIEVTDWFLSDLSGVGANARRAAGGQNGSASFDRSRSYLESVSSFPENTNVRAKLTYRAGQPSGLTSVPDGRYIPVTIHYTMAKLPEDPMQVRHADDRVGNFMTVHKDFSTEDSTFFRRYVNRWRLERGEQVGDRWRPVEPITYYIDHNVPDEYRDWFKAGVENWNTAFEAAGWEGAIRALDLPADANPDDIRYAVLRWNVSDQTGYGAIGPSKVDPRTGEILDADILFEANMFRGFRNTWRNFVNPVTPAEAFEMTLGVGAYAPTEFAVPGVELPGFAAAMEAQGAMASALLTARGEMAPGDPLPTEILRQYTVWVVMHEVGHTLGLQHNFRSSASTPNDRLHDMSFTSENGVFSSVMEYPTINLAAPGEANGDYYTHDAGSYDRWAISFAYTDQAGDAEAVAREVADLRHMYGNESGGPGALDPTINTYDLGGDPLGWGEQRSAMIREVLPMLPEYVLEDNAEFVSLTNAYNQLMNEYARALAPAVKYIGGQYMNRDHVGDGRAPFENVMKEDQDRALALLVDRLFVPGALEVPTELLQNFGANGYSHWGSNRTFDGGRFDFPYHQRMLGLQTSVLNQLVNPARLARIRDGEAKFGQDQVVTIPQLMESLTEAVWSEIGQGSVVANRRDLQRAYIDSMTRIIVEPANGTPADARSVARWELTGLREQLDGAREVGDAYTRAHVAESIARIDAALEGGTHGG